MRRTLAKLAFGLAVLLVACAKPEVSTPESRAVVEFKDRVVDYLALRGRLEAEIPKLPKKAAPEAVDASQRRLAALVKSARAGAGRGEFFTPGMQSVIKRVIGEVLSGPGGDTVKASIMDENPGLPEILIDEKYPSVVPLSTMPPPILERLPKLKGDLEYRFIGPRLVLVDTEADIILDFTEPVLIRP